MRIRLSDEDRERLGGPEWLEVDLAKLAVTEAEQLEELGLPWTAYRMGGLPGVLARIWIGLKRAGVTPPSLGDMADLNLMALLVVGDEEPGKAPSASDGGSTRSRSATRRAGTSSRKTSKP